MKTLLGLALATFSFGTFGPTTVFADDEEKTEESDEEPDPPDEPEPTPAPKPKPKNKEEFVKQDLTGHDLAGTAKSNLFEQDRFHVDKVDTAKTEKSTLVQGTITSTTFGYMESGGALADGGADGPDSASQFSRYFAEMRLQTDFRHIAGSKWDARADVRGRYAADPGQATTYPSGFVPSTDATSQSGFLGRNELDIREMWLIRGGKRSDIILGRQFVADLAGVKFDGLRVDYASSEKLTFLGFGGLYPIRGSRSIGTDYIPLRSPDPDGMGVRPAAGRFTGAGGFGAAYRTQNAYGSFGGVALVPFQAESPRFFVTGTGYWRAGPKLDLYHNAVIDLVGSNAVNAGLTNLSLGANFKPDQRLRTTVSFNRVDTETLNVQAHAFLQDPDPNLNAIQNEALLIRVAQNAARASISAGLGSLQRFEVTVATALRYRGQLVLPSPMPGGTDVTLDAGKSVEVYGAIMDRRSFKKLRIGIDGSRIFKVGGDTYQRTTSNAFRAFVARELKDGRGEWEAEASYTQSKDDNVGTACNSGVGGVTADITACYGSAAATAIMLGGNVYYRFKRDWFAMTSLFVSRQNVTSDNGGASVKDPTATGVTGFLRIAYRF